VQGDREISFVSVTRARINKNITFERAKNPHLNFIVTLQLARLVPDRVAP
jgi:hypothetical protein